MSTAPAASLEAHSDDELTHRQIVTIILGLMTAMFLSALDQSVVSTAIRTIADDLKGLDIQAWVSTAYLITSTISTPIYGKLSDIYGRKKFFLLGIVLFVFGSLLCTLANSMYQLAAYRAVQGLGAGGLMSLALAIVGDIVPPRERAKYQGYFLAVFGSSSVLGPVVGGFFAGREHILGIAGWRWVFLVNVPLGIIAFLAVNATLHLKHVRHHATIDWGGAAALIVGLVPLLVIAEQGQAWGWTSGRAWLCYIVGAAGLIAFVAVEAAMGDSALIPLRIFRNRTILIALTGGFVVGAGMFGAMMTIPQFYLQIIHGSSPTMAGLQMLPMVLGLMVASIGSGVLMSRTGRVKIFPIVGVAIMVVALLLFTRITADTPLWQVMVVMLVFGFGLGNTMQPLTLAVQAAASPREIGMATSSATFFRQIGGTFGVAIFLSVLFNRLGGNISSNLADAAKDPAFQAAVRDPQVQANPANASFIKALMTRSNEFFAQMQKDSSILNHLDPRLAHPIKQGFADSMSTIFLMGAIACAIGLVVLLFLPNLTLSNRSAASERARLEQTSAEGHAPSGEGEREEMVLDASADAAVGAHMDAPGLDEPDDDEPVHPRHALED